MLICALLAAGCSSGGGGDAFVASPGGGAPAGGGGTATGAGSVTFNFVKAQAPITVPVTTVSLRFEFFTGLEGTGTIVKNEVRDYANTITIDNVPNNVQSSVVTAYTADGFPVAQFTVNLTVPTSGNVTVSGTDGTTVPVTATTVASSPQNISLGNGDTLQVSVSVTFSNGDTVVLTPDQATSFITFVSDNPAVADIATDGTITAGTDGTATITGTFSLGGTPVSITVTVGSGVQPQPTVVSIDAQTVEAQPVVLPVGTLSQPITVVATYDNMTTQTVTAAGDGVTFSSDNADVTVDGNQQIVVAASATAPDTAVITVMYEGQVDTITVNVSAEVLQSLSATPASASLPFGGFETSFAVFGNFSSGTTAQLIPATTVTFSSSTSNFTFVNDLVNNTVVVTTDASGTPDAVNDILTAQSVGFAPNDQSLDITVSVGLVTVNSLTVTPSQVTGLIPGQVQSFMVEANLSDNTKVDVSDFAALMVSSDNTAVAVANGRQVVAVGPGTATATFTLAGAMRDVPVTVIAEQLESITIQFAGNPVPGNNTVNLPRGYVGIIEVVGVFNTGGTRKLRANEYDIGYGAATPKTAGTVPLALLQDYVPTQLTAEFTNDAPRTGTGVLPPAVGPDVDDWNNSDAISNDLLGFERDLQPADTMNPGSTTGTVRYRDTFKAIVADWRRNESIGGFAVDDSMDAAPPVQSVDSQAFFTVDIDTNLIPMGDPNGLNNRAISVTIVDPDLVTFVSADFVNYPTDDFVAKGTVREMDVRVNFAAAVAGGGVREDGDKPTQGKSVEAINNFRLAEANVDFSSNGFRQVATSIGWPAITADLEVQNAIIQVDALPVSGFGGIPVNIIPPAYSNVAGVPGDGDDTYTAGTYGTSYDTFGPTFSPSTAELAGIQPATDPGPADAAGGYGQTFVQRATVGPADTYTSQVATGNGGAGIDVVTPLLFSIDPVDNGGTLNIALGSSQIFRTVILFAGDPEGLKDRSLDYPPTMFTGSTPSFVTTLLDDNTGRIQVSGVASGNNVMTTDVDTAVNDGGILSGLIAGDLNMSRGVVVALDAVTQPINAIGMFMTPDLDSLGQTAPADSVTKITTP